MHGSVYFDKCIHMCKYHQSQDNRNFLSPKFLLYSFAFNSHFYFFLFYFIFKLYIIVLVLPNIKMNLPHTLLAIAWQPHTSIALD